jgi:hypothetical protein
MSEDGSQLRKIFIAADAFPCKAVGRTKIDLFFRLRIISLFYVDLGCKQFDNDSYTLLYFFGGRDSSFQVYAHSTESTKR